MCSADFVERVGCLGHDNVLLRQKKDGRRSGARDRGRKLAAKIQSTSSENFERWPRISGADHRRGALSRNVARRHVRLQLRGVASRAGANSPLQPRQRSRIIVAQGGIAPVAALPRRHSDRAARTRSRLSFCGRHRRPGVAAPAASPACATTPSRSRLEHGVLQLDVVPIACRIAAQQIVGASDGGAILLGSRRLRGRGRTVFLDRPIDADWHARARPATSPGPPHMRKKLQEVAPPWRPAARWSRCRARASRKRENGTQFHSIHPEKRGAAFRPRR